MKRKLPTKRFFLTVLLVCGMLIQAGNLFAQSRDISGTVTDAETGEALIGVNVSVEGTTVGGITNLDGEYTIKASTGETLVFSYVGYEQQSIVVADQTIINVILNVSTETLDEVIVVGYGTMKKSDVTGSIVSIDEDKIKQVKSVSVMESIQGLAPGVDITKSSGEAGADSRLLVRGTRSVSGDANPLFIVDGVQYGSGIDINPNDIESMEILKDVSSTAIYGAKGANGVVIITTKKGTPGQSKVTYGSYVGFNSPLGSLPYSDREYYMQYKDDLAKTKIYNRTGVWEDSVDITWQDFELEAIANGTDTDWFGELVSTGIMQNHYLGVSGGNEGVSYNLSADYTDEQSMLLYSDYKRYVIKAGIDVKVSDRLSVGSSTILSYKDRDRMPYPGKSIYLMNPLATPYDSLGNVIDNPMPRSNTVTPLYYFQDNRYSRNELTTRMFANLYANLEIADGLTLRTNFNGDVSNYRNGYYQAASAGVNVGMNTTASKDFWLSNVLTYVKDFGIHHIHFTGVQEINSGNTEKYLFQGIDPAVLGSYWYALPSVSTENITSYDPGDYPYVESSIVSYMGRMNYSLLNKYVFTASLRADGSSILAPGHKWSYFPSFSVAWNASQEDFLSSSDVISSLKVRLGYGISGNYAVDIYSSVKTTNTVPLYYEFGTSASPALGYRPVQPGNPLLGWENTAALNFGIDFGLYNNRISGNIDIYNAITTDMLQVKTLPLHTAMPNITDNVGKTRTNGIELMLHSVNVSTGGDGLKWTTDFTVTLNKEEILELSDGVLRDDINNWFVGYPVSVYYDYEKEGIWQISDSVEMALYNDNGGDYEPGDIKVRDQLTLDTDGDGIMDASDTTINVDDRVILGQRNPVWYGSITNRFEYKNFDFSFMIMARMGQMVTDAVMNSFQNRDNYDEGGYQADYWTPLNPTNFQPRLDPTVSAVNYMDYNSTLLYTDGSWAKVRDITFGYTLPESATNSMKIASLRFYVSLKNYFVLYSPLYSRGRYDPEMAGSTSWPTPKSLIVGLTVDF